MLKRKNNVVAIKETRTIYFPLGILLVLIMIPGTAFTQTSSLNKARQSVRENKQTRNSSTSQRSTNRTPRRVYTVNDADDDASALLALYILTAPWWLPSHLLRENDGRKKAFSPHPYAGGHDGFVRVKGLSAPLGQGPNGQTLLGKSTSFRFSAEAGDVLNESLTRTTFSGMISGHKGLELETSWTHFAENLMFQPGSKPSCQSLAPGATGTCTAPDELWFGDVNLSYLFAQGESIQFRTGIGIRAMIDDKDDNYGFNFTYGVDIYPTSPIVISAAMDLGNVGNAFVAHFRGSVGLMLSFAEVYGGYDQFILEDQVFGGPTFGVRAWL
jgi:hypothetical protein